MVERYSLRNQPLAWRLLVMFIVLAAILAVIIEISIGNTPKAHAGSGDVNQYSNQMRLLSDGAHCREPQMRVNGGNVVFPIVIKGTLSWKFGWDHNTWIDCGTIEKSQYVSAGWAKEGITLVSTGAGTNSAGIKYKYRRYNFDYGRTILGIPDHKTMWISITVRANGTCTFDKFSQDGNITCDQAAGGGGGGSW